MYTRDCSLYTWSVARSGEVVGSFWELQELLAAFILDVYVVKARTTSSKFERQEMFFFSNTVIMSLLSSYAS